MSHNQDHDMIIYFVRKGYYYNLTQKSKDCKLKISHVLDSVNLIKLELNSI